MGILILGITTSSVYKSEFSETFMINEKKQINNYSYTLLKLETNQDSNFQELLAVFSLYKDNKKIYNHRLHDMSFHIMPNFMS